MSSPTNPIPSRTRSLNDAEANTDGSCIVYVMARDQRLRDNHALVAAQRQAIELELPLVVLFCLQPRTGQRSREQYDFMIAGLRQVETDCQAKNIGFHLRIGKLSEQLDTAWKQLKPAAVYFDFSPLRGPLRVHAAVAKALAVSVYETDTHNIVPVWAASTKQEVGARTIRSKIMRQYADWLESSSPAVRTHPHDAPALDGFAEQETAIKQLLEKLTRNGTDISRFTPGEPAAEAAMKRMIEQRLQGYASERNNPVIDGQSELSPYLHYGQLASERVIRAVEEAARQQTGLRNDANALIEEMVVRKELSDNFCLYNQKYDSLQGAPDWARKTLAEHADDEREYTYTRQQFEQAKTHDESWNAAQRQLLRTGKIHGYMRMYWAKKVLEWTNTPATAIQILDYLNDRYHVDGNDPNGYVGVLWSVAGLHDRPWFERPVYGQVRYMNANGLKRKFKIDQYIDRYPPQS